MTFTYDIFRNFPNHGPIWIEAVQGLENARVRLLKLREMQPGDYFVYDPSAARIMFDSTECFKATVYDSHAFSSAGASPLPGH